MLDARAAVDTSSRAAVAGSFIRRSLALGGLLAFAWAGSAGAATALDWRFYDFFNVPPG